MPVETDADRAAFFDTGAFAVAAVYTPKATGIPAAVSVLYDQPDVDVGTGIAGLHAVARTALVRVSELAAPPAREDLLDIGADSFEVRKGTADVERTVYTLELRPKPAP